MASIYIAQTAAGADDGSSAANAHSIAWYNTAANWGGGAGEINPGDTVFWNGTFTTPAVPQASGTNGNLITHIFAPAAKFSKNYWPAEGAIQLNSGIGYLVFDGGDWIMDTWNGIIECTDNGTNLGNQQSSRGIGGDNSGQGDCHHVTVRNLKVWKIYVKEFGDNDWTRYGYGIDLSSSIGELLVENCYAADGDGLINMSGRANSSPSGFYIMNNVMRRSTHCINGGPNDTLCAMSHLVIAGNDFDDWDVWDTFGDSPNHADGIILYNNVGASVTTSRLDYVYIYQNRFGANVGTRTTAAIFNAMQGGSRQCSNWYIFNNLFECGGSNAYGSYIWGNGYITGGANNSYLFNNTFGGTSVSDRTTGGASYSCGGETGVYSLNNLNTTNHGFNFLGGTDGHVVQASTGPDTQANLEFFDDCWADYNVQMGGGGVFSVILGSFTYPDDVVWAPALNGFADGWQTWYSNNRGMDTPIWNTAHCDPHGSAGVVDFTVGTYAPSPTDTVARGKGANLTYIFDEMGLEAVDYNGDPRPSSGPWTIGAFETEADPVISIPAYRAGSRMLIGV